ncbi:MAG: hypothetical protein ACI31S_01245 [Bacilli bacterium]
MRKYDIKNKRNIGIIIGISIIIIIMFSLCIKLFLSSDKKEYLISEGTLVFDKDKSIIKVENDSIIKTKWNNDYYLIYGNSSSDLGKTAITYNESSGEIHLYGKYYEINSGDEINITSDETIIKSSALTKFYKLADRKYLVIDKNIKSADGLLSTSDFLLVDIDKVGNATLTNHKISLKVFSASTIVTSNYTFDIANEILTYGSDKIDLKKIIGSSNTYTKEDLVPEENIQNNSGVNNSDITTIHDNNNNENNNGSSGTKNNNIQLEEIKKETKRTSVIAVTTKVNKIVVDYVIYDPKKEYSSVYMEVKDSSSNKVSTYYLSSSSTTYELNENIFPKTSYELTFKYSYLDESNTLKVETFDKITVTTKEPIISLKITRIDKDIINYLITNDNSFPLSNGILVTYLNGNEYQREKINLDEKVGSVSISNLNNNDIVELKLVNLEKDNRIVNGLTVSDKFKY